MNKREIIKLILEGKNPPYTPWSFSFTEEPREMLKKHYETDDLDPVLGNHVLGLGDGVGFFKDLGGNLFQDVFGVIWDRSIDKDIGNVKDVIMKEPTLKGYSFPDPLADMFYSNIEKEISIKPDMFRVFQIGFSLFERAWTLRGMENLLIDFKTEPDFVHELLSAIADYNISQVKKAVEYDIDAVYFGDDWGMQHGLIMGIDSWREFIKPQLVRMYSEVKKAGKYIFIHSCGDVDELFDDLVEIGLNCFNPFQPEVMDIYSIMEKYRGRLTFFGGLSTQKTLPYGSVNQVKFETNKLLKAGLSGNYILSPAHAVEGDVPLENILAFIKMAQDQTGYQE
jgi:uroporphyrinogen decarboxylase